MATLKKSDKNVTFQKSIKSDRKFDALTTFTTLQQSELKSQTEINTTNPLLKLGGGLDEVIRGKAQVAGVRAKGHANPNEYFPLKTNMRFVDTSNKMPAYSAEEIKVKNQIDINSIRQDALKFFTN